MRKTLPAVITTFSLHFLKGLLTLALLTFLSACGEGFSGNTISDQNDLSSVNSNFLTEETDNFLEENINPFEPSSENQNESSSNRPPGQAPNNPVEAETPIQALKFAEGRKLSASAVTTTIAGDFNNDGLEDIVSLEGGKHSGGYKLFHWFEAPNMIKRNLNNSLSHLPFLGSAQAIDLDRDGDLDFVYSEDMHSGSTKKAYVNWLENPGAGFASSRPWTRHRIATYNSSDKVEHINDMSLKDMDGDGKVDIVIRHLGVYAVKIIFQNSITSWTTRTIKTSPREGLSVGDIDNDGRPDILLNGFWLAGPYNPRKDNFKTFTIDTTFSKQPVTGLNNSTKSDMADLNKDGLLDIVLATAEGARGSIAVYLAGTNPRAGGWKKITLQGNVTGAHQVHIADLNFDGKLDIFTGLAFGQSGIFTFTQGANSSQWTKKTLVSKYGLYTGVLADIDGDRDLDIVGPTDYRRQLYLHENNSIK